MDINKQVQGPELLVKVRNTGSSMGEIGGSCGWKCPVAIKQVTGFLSAGQGEIIKPGEERVLSPNGGVVNVCDGNKLPLQLTCNFSVQTFDKNYRKQPGVQATQYSTTVTPP